MADALKFLCFGLLTFAVAPVVISVGIVMLIDKVWGYEPDAYELAYGERAADAEQGK